MQAVHFYGWQDECRQYSTDRVPQFDKNTTACTYSSNGLQSACQRTTPNKTAGCRQLNIPEMACRMPAAMSCKPFEASQICVCMCMHVFVFCPGTALPQQQFFCAPHGDSAVRGGWVSHAVHTHTRHKAQLRRVLQHRRYSECKHALHTHTILVLQLWRVYAGPFSGI